MKDEEIKFSEISEIKDKMIDGEIKFSEMDLGAFKMEILTPTGEEQFIKALRNPGIKSQILAKTKSRGHTREHGKLIVVTRGLTVPINPNDPNNQLELLKSNIKALQEKADVDEINYVHIGNPKFFKFTQGSIEMSLPESCHKLLVKIIEKLGEKKSTLISHDSLDPFVRDGLNCTSFVILMWCALGLSYKNTFISKFFHDPKTELKAQSKAQKREDDDPTEVIKDSHRCFVL